MPLFSSASTPVDDHPELILSDRDPTLRRGVWAILVGALVYMGMLVLASDGDFLARIRAAAGLVVLAAVTLGLLRYRGTGSAVRFLSLGGWLLATYAAFVGEGVRAPILLAYPMIVIFSGWMLGARYCVGLLLASCIAVLFMVEGQSAGVIGNLRPVTPAMTGFALVIILAISTAITLYLLEVFQRRYAEECRLNEQIRRQLLLVAEREGYQQALLENFPFMVWLKDDQGRYLAVNQAFVRGFGWPSVEAVVGKTDLDIATAERTAESAKEDLAVFPSSSADLADEMIEIGGQSRWYETCKSPVLVGGQVIGMVGYARDITEKKAVEAAIAESRNLMRAVIDTVPLRVYWMDRDLRYLGCNEAFARDAGKASPDEVIGRDDYQMKWADKAESFRAADRAVIESGSGELSVEESQAASDGAVRWLRSSRVPLRNQLGEIIGLLGIYEDITEFKLAAAELEMRRSSSV